jgi:hypothetical protein
LNDLSEETKRNTSWLYTRTGQPHQNVLARSSEIFALKTAVPTGEPHAAIMDIHCPRNPFAAFDGPITIAARTVFYIK